MYQINVQNTNLWKLLNEMEFGFKHSGTLLPFCCCSDINLCSFSESEK